MTTPSEATSSPLPQWDLIVDGQDFPEGPAWDGHDTLFFSNCKGRNIMKVDIASGAAAVFVVAQEEPFTLDHTNGLTVGPDGALYACEYGLRPGILRVAADGSTRFITDNWQGNALSRPNDLAFAKDDWLYFTDPKSYGADKPDGAVYRVDVNTGETQRVAADLCFPNGLAFTADGSQLLLAESAKHRVLKFDVGEDGTLVNQRVFAEMPGGDPDGMAFDEAGNLYVAHFGGGAVVVFSPEGELLRKLETPGTKPSNVEFAGANRRMLFVTEDETNAVYRTRVETPGLLLFGQPVADQSKENQ